MPTYNISRNEKVYIGPQASFRTIPNTTGAWDTTGVKWLRHNRIVVNPRTDYQDNPFKTGKRSNVIGFVTRRGGSLSITNLPVILSGTAGTVPDMDLILQAVFGAASSGSGTNVYAFSDSGQKPFVLARYWTIASTETQHICWGCVVEEITFRFNGNVFEADVTVSCGYVLDNDNFSNEDSIGKAGLTSFPNDPAITSTNGNPMTGFTGSATIDSNDMAADVSSMVVRIRTGNVIVADRYKDAYPQRVVGGARMVSVAVTLDDSDSTGSVNMKAKAKARTPMDITLAIGNTAGYQASFAIKQVVMTPATFDDSNAYVSSNFGDAPAHASSLTTIDDLVLTLS